MHNLVLFCKTYIGDLNRIKILKDSVDKYNADKIPFYIVCPKSDMEIMQKTLINGTETYHVELITDESVLVANKIPSQNQNWETQQIIKLGFYKLNLCKNYIIVDSDTYFIRDFHFDDFMYDELTPYLCMENRLVPDRPDIAKQYLKRKGQTYNFIIQGQVFSADILADMELNLLQKNNITLVDLIKIFPYEFQWYGEWFLKSRIFVLHPMSGKIKVYWANNQYKHDKHCGIRQCDLVNMGYIGITLNNGWVRSSYYKDPVLGFIPRTIRTIHHKYTFGTRDKTIKYKLHFLAKIPRLIIREINSTKEENK